MRPDKYFFEEETDRFSCILCGGKSTTNQKKHARGERHQNLVRLDKERLQRQQERIAANEALNQDESNRPRVEIETITNTDLQNEQLQPLSAQNDDESDVVPINLFEDGESEHEEEEMDWLNLLGVAIDQIDDEPADSFEEHPVPAYQRDVVEIEEITTIDSPWFPFVNKEHINIMSDQFARVGCVEEYPEEDTANESPLSGRKGISIWEANVCARSQRDNLRRFKESLGRSPLGFPAGRHTWKGHIQDFTVGKVAQAS
ncbi:hypothetical protein PGT21_036276 [Puccinia graminis f. sp. tritici]|uniref:Uncharacterized protein n=1 Tax=Puccinia graminis f. sp. tritici TaxID=56615 RepID=A0A5B0PCZ1_PUCGR|nr:hypothetical protein PGT21_036276 [Puccinia graminis f. sp. tritici]